MKKFIITLSVMTLVLSSCKMGKRAVSSTGKVINNYATTTENMFKLSPGMSLEEVSKTLECVPTDFYSNLRDHKKIVVYKYKKNFQSFFSYKELNSEKSLRDGDPVYADESNLYIIFDSKTNNMLYYITESGRKSGQFEIFQTIKLKTGK